MTTIPQDSPKAQSQPFYVYTLTNSLTGLVFYVGKGHNKQRMTNHEWQARRGAISHKCNTIRKIWRLGGTVIRQKVAEFTNEEDAFIYEWCLVTLIYGRDNLTNTTDGGDGVRGSTTTTHPPSQREKHREIVKKIFSSPEKIELQRQITQRHWEENPAYHKTSFMSPDGKIHEAATIPNLSEFCRQHGLDRPNMIKLANGELHHYKKWTRYPEIKAQRDFRGTYTGPGFISPDGTIYTTTDVDNLTRFCRTHGLQPSCMSNVAQGKASFHKGWIRYDAGI